MGLFDTLTVKLPLPELGYTDREFQTKDTPDQFCSSYEIRADGTLWVEKYDIESNPNTEGTRDLLGIWAGRNRVDERWEPENFTGTIVFYDYDCPYEFMAILIFGTVVDIVKHQQGTDKSPTSLSTMYKHEKTGTLYRVIMHAEMAEDSTPVVVYQSMNDAKIFVMPANVFFTSEFTPLIDSSTQAG